MIVTFRTDERGHRRLPFGAGLCSACRSVEPAHAVSPLRAAIPDAVRSSRRGAMALDSAAAKTRWAPLPSRPAAAGCKPACRLLHCIAVLVDAARLRRRARRFALAAHPVFAGPVVF